MKLVKLVKFQCCFSFWYYWILGQETNISKEK